jgi:thymidylate synthase (FAD)
MVVAAARVSTSGETALEMATLSVREKSGLINCMMREQHGSPFEHGLMTFFVHAPIFVWRQIHRHRIGFSYNEQSGRYTKLDPVFWLPRRERPMLVPRDFKPMRPHFYQVDDEEFFTMSIADMKDIYRRAWTAYEDMVNGSIATEVARTVLPVGIYSSCWVTCNPRSLMAFLKLRTRDERAMKPSYPQAEVEEVAQQMERHFAALWPVTYRAFNENGRMAP